MWNPFKWAGNKLMWPFKWLGKKAAVILIKRLIKELGMKEFLDAIKGYKTYVAMVIGIIATGLLAQGIIDQGTFDLIYRICLFLGIAFARAGMKKK